MMGYWGVPLNEISVEVFTLSFVKISERWQTLSEQCSTYRDCRLDSLHVRLTGPKLGHLMPEPD